MHSVLPRDSTYARKLTPGELMQSVSVSWASTTAFFAEMIQRYGHFMKNYEPPAEFQKKIANLEEKLRATELERDKAEAAKKKAEVANNSLITALDEEREKGPKRTVDQGGNRQGRGHCRGGLPEVGVFHPRPRRAHTPELYVRLHVGC